MEIPTAHHWYLASHSRIVTSWSSNVRAIHQISSSRPAIPTASRQMSFTGGVRWTPLSAATMLDPEKNGMTAHSALPNPRLKLSIACGVTPRYLVNQPSASWRYARPIMWHTPKAAEIRIDAMRT
jgi:hypothetical protein